MAEQQGITKITVQGFKSLYEKAEVEIRPLTVLAGANSSGKSSIMQPLLLMKQTLEAEYDSKSLLLNGPIVNFTSPSQFMNGLTISKYLDIIYDNPEEEDGVVFAIEIALNKSSSFDFSYLKTPNSAAFPFITNYKTGDSEKLLAANLSHKQIIDMLGNELDDFRKLLAQTSTADLEWRTVLSRGFVQLSLYSEFNELVANLGDVDFKLFPIGSLKRLILEMIYIAGFRGHPQRDYPLISSDFVRFQGRFENYTASIIHSWQRSEQDEDKQRLNTLGEQLKELGLAPFTAAQPLNDVQIEVRVGRTMQSNQEDTVSIADVGFGVSQVLPVLVALLVAKVGQLVYIEQPELHLHPRAQVKLAQILADAANRGVRVVVETHSSLLLLGLQTLIAEGNLKPENTILHWFTRDEEGKTTVRSEVPDENGAYGDWPEDFADVEMDTQSKYLNAVATRQERVGTE